MIKFEKIRAKNFLSYGNQFTEIDLEAAKTTIITGKNGSGKTSINDFLVFALYGKPHRKVNLGQLINSINKKDSVVEVEFSISNVKYMIRRGQKPKIFEIYVDGKMLNQDAAQRDYQKYLEEQILTMNYKTFNQFVILSASNFVPFMQLAPSDRRTIIENILDIEIFSQMNSCLKTRNSFVQGELKELQNKIQLLTQKTLMKENHISDLESEYTNQYEEIDEQIKELSSEKCVDVEKYKKMSESLKADLETIKEKSEKVNGAKIKSERQCHHYEKIRADKLREKEFFEANDTCHTCLQEIDENFKNEKIESIDKDVASIDKNLEDSQQLLLKANEIHKRFTEFSQKASQTKYELSSLKNSIDNVGSTIEKLEAKKTIKKENNLLEDYQKELESYAADLKKLQAGRDKLNESIANFSVIGTILKDDGIKAKVIKQYLPVINKLINGYLQQMDFHVLFEIDENFNETIKSRYRDKFTYNSFSEGQKLRIDLALLFTWRELTKMRNSLSTNLLILDEILDASADTEGTQAFFKILKKMSGDVNIFIISHRAENITDSFNSSIEVELKDNFSKLKRTF